MGKNSEASFFITKLLKLMNLFLMTKSYLHSKFSNAKLKRLAYLTNSGFILSSEDTSINQQLKLTFETHMQPSYQSNISLLDVQNSFMYAGTCTIAIQDFLTALKSHL